MILPPQLLDLHCERVEPLLAHIEENLESHTVALGGLQFFSYFEESERELIVGSFELSRVNAGSPGHVIFLAKNPKIGDIKR